MSEINKRHEWEGEDRLKMVEEEEAERDEKDEIIGV